MAESKIYRRERYLSRLRPFYDADDLIKVITGIRRCGKSCLLRSVADELRDCGVPESNIVFLNLDRREYRSVRTIDQLGRAIDAVMADAGDGLRYLSTRCRMCVISTAHQRHPGGWRRRSF
ncbi:MAG: AAA family ATPase [Bifidobacterium breve]